MAHPAEMTVQYGSRRYANLAREVRVSIFALPTVRAIAIVHPQLYGKCTERMYSDNGEQTRTKQRDSLGP
jgi:hypothetical protein